MKCIQTLTGPEKSCTCPFEEPKVRTETAVKFGAIRGERTWPPILEQRQ